MRRIPNPPHQGNTPCPPCSTSSPTPRAAVWAVLAALVLLGLRQTRTQTMSAARVWLVPAVVGAASLAGALRGFAGAGELLTGACWAVGAALGFAVQPLAGPAAPRQRQRRRQLHHRRQHRAAAAVRGRVPGALRRQRRAGDPAGAGGQSRRPPPRPRSPTASPPGCWPRARARSGRAAAPPASACCRPGHNRRLPPPADARRRALPARPPAPAPRPGDALRRQPPAAPRRAGGAGQPRSSPGSSPRSTAAASATTLVYAQCIGLSIWLVHRGRPPPDARGAPTAGRAGWRGVALVAGGLRAGLRRSASRSPTRCSATRAGRDYLRKPGRCCATSARRPRSAPSSPAGSTCAARPGRTARSVAAAAHAATLARLNLLQSQLEPHMLFNTLANLRALIAADPAARAGDAGPPDRVPARHADASRQAEHPLADEFARIADYLALMQVRMGDRLRAEPTLPPELDAIARAAAAAAAAGGERDQARPRAAARRRASCTSRAALDGDDAGAARGRLRPRPRGRRRGARARARSSRAPASALAQVRERLHTLHGDAARFTLAARAEGGTLRRDPPAHSARALPDHDTDMTTALIAEDEPLLAQALRAELARAWPELQLLDTAVDGDDAVERALAAASRRRVPGHPHARPQRARGRRGDRRGMARRRARRCR